MRKANTLSEKPSHVIESMSMSYRSLQAASSITEKVELRRKADSKDVTNSLNPHSSMIVISQLKKLKCTEQGPNATSKLQLSTSSSSLCESALRPVLSAELVP